ncbi:MAG: LysM peptidoglycan-binding domain-containing protein [Deltaproteobacteria bacterium]|nr:LysM peptidoglycan-binding domain-containing protein [Deltaproteobacteria bacterium]
MRKTFWAVLLTGVFALTPFIAHADEVNIPPGGGEAQEAVLYTIVRRDTLWDISKRFLKNPFKWPRIWKLNPYIKNPDLIYPGDIVKVSPDGIEVNGVKVAGKEFTGAALPMVALLPEKIEDAPDSVKEKKVELESEAMPEVKAEVKAPEEAKPAPLAEKFKSHDILRKGFISKAGLDASGAVIGTKEKKLLMNGGDEVMASFKTGAGVNAGDRFTIFTAGIKLKHPVTNQTVGYATNILGSLVVTKTGDVAEALIERSYKEIEQGAKLMPYKEVPPAVEMLDAEADVTGHIVASLEGEGYFGKGDIVYIDKGSSDGLKTGNTMRIYKDSGKAVDPVTRKEITLPQADLGTLVVIDTEDKTSSGIVTKSLRTINKGDLVSTAKRN